MLLFSILFGTIDVALKRNKLSFNPDLPRKTFNIEKYVKDKGAS